MSITDDLSLKALSEITIYNKYAKYLPDLQRRETWVEICNRSRDMHKTKYPSLAKEIDEVFEKFVVTKKVLPSMRGMQFAGKPVFLSPNRQYNCSYAPVDSVETFSEIMFLLLGGTGVGYSVQKHHVAKLPEVKKPSKRKRRHLISDSIEGWADAVKVLLTSYFTGSSTIVFDFSDIREKGALLKTSGGKAPGPQPLKDCLHNLRKILDAKETNSKLTPLEAHDIVCYIADAVLAGGIRRAALIAGFSIDDEEMLTCKFGNWFELNPQRARANNSAIVLRHKIKKNKFFDLWKKIQASGSGEPGIVFSNNQEWFTNPCGEIALRPYQFCNLTTTNVSNVESQQDLEDRVKAAAFLGTLQAGYTDFHYLRDIWKETTEKDALIGVSLTGIASGAVLKYDLLKATKIVKAENKRIAKIIGINSAARLTCVKPEGTTSCVLGCSSGIHAWHSEYYIRRQRVLKNENIYQYLEAKLPKLIEDDFFKPAIGAIISFPVKAPKGSIFRTESAIDLLERVKRFNIEWVKPGHIKGDNTHNVSATISIKNDEWDTVGEWMWENRRHYSGLSVLPYDGGNYVQAPFEECTKEKYEEMMGYIKEIHLDKIKEYSDTTTLAENVACGGGNCEIL